MTSKRWFIVTNSDNLKFFYDCGLVVDRQAFPTNSYMHDMQAERPKGFLPCFSIDNLTDALKAAKREDENLITCLVEIELKNVNFESVYVQTCQRKKGEFENISADAFPTIDAVEVLLPAPLPLNCIKNILLSDAKKQKTIVHDFTSAFGEFPPKLFNNNPKLFKELKSPTTDLELEADLNGETFAQEEINDRELNYSKAFAYGGALALSFYQTKNGRLSCELFEAFANNTLEKKEHSHLLQMIKWVFNNPNESELSVFYSLIFNLIVGEDDLSTVRYDLLKLFENKEKLPPAFAHVSGLAVRLRQLVERTYEDDLDVYFSKLIEHYEAKEKGSSKNYLLISMIFVRDHSETMLKFYHEKFTEEDYFLLAVFFGLIKGMSKMPLEIRKIDGLRDWVSFKMVELMHCSHPSSVTFEKGSSSPVLIHNKFFKKTSVPKKQDALQAFCSFLGIEEQEIITWLLTPKDEYKVKSGNIIFSKRPPLFAEVNNEQLEHLMLLKSIKETDELFDFNEALEILKD
jgi:hypothetical protein